MVDVNNIDDWLAQSEAQVPNLRKGCEKRVIWRGDKCARTRVSVVFIHGFSATGEELRPLPDLVAQALGANLFFTRLDGHGQDGVAMGRATLQAWERDVAEAIDIGAGIGEAVIVIGCSTGCSLITLALKSQSQVKGAVFISPNFGLRHQLAQLLLDLPGARHWGHFAAGRERAFDPISDAHAAFWTTHYPTQAVYPMGDAVRAARKLDVAAIKTPLFFAINQDDQVISPKRAAQITQRWGGPVTHYDILQTPQDDKMGHIMAGDIFSPGQTRPLAYAIVSWAKKL